MAKKKTQKDKVTIQIPHEEVEGYKLQGKNDADIWFTRLCIDRRNTPTEIDKRLKESLTNAKQRRDDYEQKFYSTGKLMWLFEYGYWQLYHATLRQYMKREEPIRKHERELPDFFNGRMSFAKFQNLLELARLTSKGKMIKDGVAYKVLATFDVLVDKGILRKNEKVPFRNAFTKYYTGDPYVKSAYSNALTNDKGDIKGYKDALESALK